jgi:hypothetical protein
MQKNTERRDGVAKAAGARRERSRAASQNPRAAAHPNGAAEADGAMQNTADNETRRNSEMRRLVHKAAWTRMFGHAEPRNPYSK